MDGTPSIAEAIDAYEQTLLPRSPRTARTYRTALRRFVAYLRERGDDPAQLETAALQPTILEEYYIWQLQALRADRDHTRERAHRRSAVGYLAGVRAFVRFLDRRGWLGPGVSYARLSDGARTLVGRLTYPTPQVDDAVANVVTYVNTMPLPPAEQRQAYLTALRDRAILTTLYATALRRAELSALNRIDVRDGQASEAIITGKGEKDRVVFFDAASQAAIRAYLRARGDTYRPLFLRHDDGRGAPGRAGERWRLSPQSIWQVVHRYGQLAGVEVTTHHLRHLKARVLLNNGLPLEALQDVLGHASPETTKRIYAPFSRQRLRELVETHTLPAEAVAARARQDIQDDED